ncbi:MAG: fructose-6-phosphate aldolase [Thermoanaerobaculia bacterium]
MKIFLDTASLEEIKKGLEWNMVDGVTTNPSLIAKEGEKDYRKRIEEIAKIVKGPISAEVISTSFEGMIKEARELHSIAENIVIKIPMTEEGIKATKFLSDEEIPVNVTLIFSPNQALIAAKAGARYVSPFVGRLDDVGNPGMEIVSEIIQIYQNYGFDTEIIVASIRNPEHVRIAALQGAHISTMPFSTLKQLFKHPLTDIGLQRFIEDYKKAGLKW